MASLDYERVRELFLHAVSLDDSHRREFVENLHGEEAGVVAELRRLLRHHAPDQRIFSMERKTEELPPVQPDSSPTGTRKFDTATAELLSDGSPAALERNSTYFRSGKQKQSVLLASATLCVLLFSIGFWLYFAVHKAVSESLQTHMGALLGEQSRAIHTWLETEQKLISTWARDSKVTTAVRELATVAGTAEDLNGSLRSASAKQDLHLAINAETGSPDLYQYAVWNREGTLLADSCVEHEDFLGNGTTEYGAALLSRVFRGETVLWLPTNAGFITADFELRGPITKPGIAYIAPVKESNGKPIAAILISSPRLQQRLEELLHSASLGNKGDAYAVTQDGCALTDGRFSNLFTKSAESLGLDYKPYQRLRIADPGGNLAEGFQPSGDPGRWPLTRAAASVVSGIDGADFTGYRNYTGNQVVGMWKWLPQYRFGIVTEIDRDAAFSPLSPLNRAYLAIGLLVATTIVGGIMIAWLLLRHRRRSGHENSIGPYTLKHLIGEGGFARVYLAAHALLKRPAAVKVLKNDHQDARNLARFEREVRLASSLTHPNTIGIYDYGVSEDGRFYCAMEYIQGLSLQQVIDIDGAQPPERVAWILIQICRSLREAHLTGLIHRDIKPQNVMMCCQGAEHDSVKVLDFGLAKHVTPQSQKRVTETQQLIGTPLYIAPERILDPNCMDPRQDIFSLGVLGYYLLVGKEPIDAVDSMDALAQTVHRRARRPSEQTRQSIPSQLDNLIAQCQERSMEDRPRSVDRVLSQLLSIRFTHSWNSNRAAKWWKTHQQQIQDVQSSQPDVDPNRTTRVLTRASKNKPATASAAEA